MTKVLVLGGSGMLGSMVVDVLSRNSTCEVTATVRDAALAADFRARLPRASWTAFAVDGDAASLEVLDGYTWIVNAIGITKPLIRDDHPVEIERAIDVNGRLPHLIGRRAERSGARVLQIATDCVYAGRKGAYVETDEHDALDVYGKTKSLGESFQENVHHLRCSIIGPEPKDFKFLIEWFRRQPRAATVKGFVNHRWNGVTTLHFARLCEGIIARGIALPHIQHVVPSEPMTKAAMLHQFGVTFRRPDIQIEDIDATVVVDRTLNTTNPDLNRRLWEAAGYPAPPSVLDMIGELGAFDYRAAPAPAVEGRP
jgi:dTDP-4-dehydrorhamnose reductase